MKKQTKPIKRDKALQPLSRDHHHGLLLSWKIRTGFKKNIDPHRIKSYANWFYKNFLTTHFDEEEQYLFPLIGNDHELVKKALTDHRRLRRLFEEEQDIQKALGLIEEELDAHIRFEERILFNEIQKVAQKEQLQKVNDQLHQEIKDPDEQWEDHFWKVK